MKVYVVANLKGGVGKTTTTVNVAYTFSEMGGRVLVIDLDPQCNCTRFFAKVNGYSKTVRDVLENPKGINSAVYRTKYQDIDIVKGSVKITEQKTPWRLKEALGYLKKGNVAAISTFGYLEKDYDVCLIDTRPVFDMLTMNALYAADVFLTPVKFDNFCRDNLTMVEDAYHEILENNPDLKWKIFANMVSNTKAQKLSSEDLIAKHDYPFMQSCSRTAIVDNALSLYKPVAKHRVMSNVAQDFIDLVEELLED